jgi:hypothetical protein
VEFVNATKMPAGYTMGMEPSGRQLLVVVVKGTFTIPENGGEAVLTRDQAALVEADIATREPGFSAPAYESDYAPRKPRCDVLLNGSAYAPQRRPTERVTVSLQVGPISKSFDVVGDRVWQKGFFFTRPSRPLSFTVMPISYNKAFGGVDNTHSNERRHAVHLENPVGIGFHTNVAREFVDGRPLPNTEARGRPIKKPNVRYRPMAFGAVGRGWQPRASFAGTADQNWLDNVFPFLPADFREDYYQAAPADQQMAYPRGGEEIFLKNLTRSGETRFRLPSVRTPVEITNGAYERTKVEAAPLDTLLIEPDINRFILLWRSSFPLKKNMHEIRQVVVGEMRNSWYRARDLGKSYHLSINHFISSNQET